MFTDVYFSLITDEVNVLQELSQQVSNSSNSSMSMEDSRCPVLQVGQYSTLALPLRQLFTDGYGFFSTLYYYCITKMEAVGFLQIKLI